MAESVAMVHADDTSGSGRGRIGIAYEQNCKIMTSSNSGLKIAKKFKIVLES